MFLINRGKTYFNADQYKRFTWSLVLSSTTGTYYLEFFDKRSGEIIYKYDARAFLSSYQRGEPLRSPSTAIRLVHFVKEQLDECGLSHYGIRIDMCSSTNRNPFEVPIDPKVDLTEEKIRYIFPYKWVRFAAKDYNKLDKNQYKVDLENLQKKSKINTIE
ncbi:hypothetical protein SCG7109_AF_00060 [Chlamydiales bacterium SCGC AG-110-M15]|nr:hypothetical protein SCG7109_AF_00060 [Chlamydiales bacterium SCGC AG-110-M15]